MPSVMETRDQLCHTVASLDAHASLDEVYQALDPILESFQQEADESSLTRATFSDGVTPLMVACDKAQEGCIKWILKNTKDNPSLLPLLGSPLDHAESGNTATHYAANSGCIPAMQLLCEMLDDNETNSSRARKLISQRNDNYDTPVMLAVVKGHVAFLRQIRRLVENEGATSSCEVKQLFELVNDDEDTALSLACGHGHVDVVNFLLQEVGVTVTYDHVKGVEQTLQQVDAALESSPYLEGQHRDRRNDVHRCLVLLKVTLGKSAQVNMEHLLAEEDEVIAKKQRSGKAKKKKLKRKQKCKGKTGGDANLGNELASRTQKTEDNDSDSESDTGADDSKTCSVSQTEMISTNRDVKGEQKSYEVNKQAVASKDNIGTISEPTFTALRTGPRTNGWDSNLDVDAIIEALCLDASMLLLSPQEMALNLSPCQLDAIAGVLRNQIQAVKEARTIQTRLRNQGNKS